MKNPQSGKKLFNFHGINYDYVLRFLLDVPMKYHQLVKLQKDVLFYFLEVTLMEPIKFIIKAFQGLEDLLI